MNYDDIGQPITEEEAQYFCEAPDNGEAISCHSSGNATVEDIKADYEWQEVQKEKNRPVSGNNR